MFSTRVQMLLLVSFKLCTSEDLDSFGQEDTCGYEGCNAVKKGMLNVHIVPHTHYEYGFHRTFYEHYTGYEEVSDKTDINMKRTLDLTITELWSNDKRKFTFSDFPYFFHWWSQRDSTVRRMVYQLVRQGRLYFVGGGWGMPDEATTSYHALIEAFTYSLRKLNSTFQNCGRPLVAWQVDCYGHSREFASLAAQMAFGALFVNPLSFEDELSRMRRNALEMLWRGSDDLGSQSDIFTHKLFDGYWAPPGFCFSSHCSDPLMVSRDVNLINTDERVDLFIESMLMRQAPNYNTSNVMVIMGKVFAYFDASVWFANIDKLIDAVNERSLKTGKKVHLFYSTPACYLKAVHSTRPWLETKQDDFIPIAYDHQTYLTGLFTTHPPLKLLVREALVTLQMSKQLQVFAQLENNDKIFEEFQWTFGLLQDHSIITGAMRPHVKSYYVQKMHTALQKSTSILKQAFNKLREGPKSTSFYRCSFNISSCDYFNGESALIVIYNPLSWPVTIPVRLPVLQETGHFEIWDGNGKKIPSAMLKIHAPIVALPFRSPANHEVVFMAEDLPPLGYRSYFFESINTRTKKKRSTLLKNLSQKKQIIRQVKNSHPTLLNDDFVEYEYFDDDDDDETTTVGDAATTDSKTYIETSKTATIYKEENYNMPSRNEPYGNNFNQNRGTMGITTNFNDIFTIPSRAMTVIEEKHKRKIMDKMSWQKKSGVWQETNFDINPNRRNFNISYKHNVHSLASAVNSLSESELAIDALTTTQPALTTYVTESRVFVPTRTVKRLKGHFIQGPQPDPHRATQAPFFNQGAPSVNHDLYMNQKRQLSNQNAQPLDQNVQSSNQNAQLLNQNAQPMNQNAQLLDQNVQSSHQNAQLLNQNMQSMNQNKQNPYMNQNHKLSFSQPIQATLTNRNNEPNVPYLDQNNREHFNKYNDKLVSRSLKENTQQSGIIKNNQNIELPINQNDKHLNQNSQSNDQHSIPSANQNNVPDLQDIYVPTQKRAPTVNQKDATNLRPNIDQIIQNEKPPQPKVPFNNNNVSYKQNQQIIFNKHEQNVQQYQKVQHHNQNEAHFQHIPLNNSHSYIQGPNRKHSFRKTDVFSNKNATVDHNSMASNFDPLNQQVFQKDDLPARLKGGGPTLKQYGEPDSAQNIKEKSQESSANYNPITKDPPSHQSAQESFQVSSFTQTDTPSTKQDKVLHVNQNNGQPLHQNNGQPLNQNNGQTLNQNNGPRFKQNNKQPLNQNNGQVFNKNNGRTLNQKIGQPLNQNNGQAFNQNNEKSLKLNNERPLNQNNRQAINQNNGQTLNQNHGQPLNQNNGQVFNQNYGQSLKQNNERPLNQNNKHLSYQNNEQYFNQNDGLPSNNEQHFKQTNGQHIYQNNAPSNNQNVVSTPKQKVASLFDQNEELSNQNVPSFNPDNLRSSNQNASQHNQNNDHQSIKQDKNDFVPYGQKDLREHVKNDTTVKQIDIRVNQMNVTSVSNSNMVLPSPQIDPPKPLEAVTEVQGDTMTNLDGFYILKDNQDNDEQVERTSISIIKVAEESTDLFFGNAYVRIDLHPVTRKITKITLANGIVVKLDVQLYYYVSDDPARDHKANADPVSGRKESRKAPGAMIMRTSNIAIPIINFVEAKVYKTPIVEEYHCRYSDWASIIVRVYSQSPVVILEWTVGPVPVADGRGKEVFVRYATDLVNDGVFYTDSNGRQTLKRIRNVRPMFDPVNNDPVAGNIYPVTSKIYIEDLKRNIRFSVFPDRAEGGTSLYDGEIDLMLQRRILTDDMLFKGFANETHNNIGVVVRGKHNFYLSRADYKPNKIFEKKLAKEIELTPQVLVSDPKPFGKSLFFEQKNEKSFLKRKLPVGLHILTVQEWNDKTLLLRIENYLEKTDVLRDGVKYLKLGNIFSNIDIFDAQETTLGANIWLKDYTPLLWNKKDKFIKNFNEFYASGKAIQFAEEKHYTSRVPIDVSVNLKFEPQKIRTFVCSFVYL